MATVSNPVLFSQHFGVAPDEMDKAGLVDTYVNVDIPLFIDPTLLGKSSHIAIAQDGMAQFRSYFQKVFSLLKVSLRRDDVAWKAAEKLLSLEEPAENGLGYSGNRRFGASRPEEIRDTIFETIRDILRIGSENPELVGLLGFFEEGVGPDTISDFTTIAIGESLAKITHEFCLQNSVPMTATPFSSFSLPVIQRGNRNTVPVLLVPQDIVRDLPMANDWSGVWDAVQHNRALRERVSTLLAGVVRPTVAEQKEALRQAALHSAATLETFLQTVKEHSANYDPNVDSLGYYKFRDLLLQDPQRLQTGRTYDLSRDANQVRQIALDALDVFKHQVENANLWEELWVDDKPKRERAAQLFFAAISEAFCRAHGVDISPECNMGGGPVDFKFSNGFYSRVIVELKRSGGTVVHGYAKQLEFYKQAASTEYGIFVVIDYGDGDAKIEKILEMRNEGIRKGERVSDVVLIDGNYILYLAS